MDGVGELRDANVKKGQGEKTGEQDEHRGQKSDGDRKRCDR